MFEKLNWIVKLLRSRTYLILTDKEAVVHIPLHDTTSFNNILLLNAQRIALENFKERLEETITEHDWAVRRINQEGN